MCDKCNFDSKLINGICIFAWLTHAFVNGISHSVNNWLDTNIHGSLAHERVVLKWRYITDKSEFVRETHIWSPISKEWCCIWSGIYVIAICLIYPHWQWNIPTSCDEIKKHVIEDIFPKTIYDSNILKMSCWFDSASIFFLSTMFRPQWKLTHIQRLIFNLVPCCLPID